MRTLRLLLFCFLNSALASCSAALVSVDQPVDFIAEDFEDGFRIAPGSGWRVSKSSNDAQGEQIAVKADVAHSGAHSLKAEVRPVAKSGAKLKRAEIESTYKAEFGALHFYRFSVYLPQNAQQQSPRSLKPRQWALFAQWQQAPDVQLGESWRNPTLAFLVDQKGELTVLSRWHGKKKTEYMPGKGYGKGHEHKRVLVSSGALPKNQWITFELAVRWRYDASGMLYIWQDGQLIVNYRGPNSFNDAQGPYQKLGVYRDSTIGEVQTAYFDDYQMYKGGVVALGQVNPQWTMALTFNLDRFEFCQANRHFLASRSSGLAQLLSSLTPQFKKQVQLNKPVQKPKRSALQIMELSPAFYDSNLKGSNFSIKLDDAVAAESLADPVWLLLSCNE